jgi:hypothetical protein
MKHFACIVLLLSSISLFSQERDSTILIKGRYITGLSGSISSQSVNGNILGGQVTRKVNEYIIGTKSGYFIQDGWTLGLDFTLSKSEFKNPELHVSSEKLSLGLWSRYYFMRYYNGALYAELTPFYTVINELNDIQTANFVFAQELHGRGYGIKPAFGFAYLINKNVGFGMSVSYQIGRIYADRTDLILETISKEDYEFSQLNFNFSFQIYLDQFFF